MKKLLLITTLFCSLLSSAQTITSNKQLTNLTNIKTGQESTKRTFIIYNITLSEDFLKITTPDAYLDLYSVEDRMDDTISVEGISYELSFVSLKNISCSSGDPLSADTYVDGWLCKKLGMFSLELIGISNITQVVFCKDQTLQEIKNDTRIMLKIFDKISAKNNQLLNRKL